MADKILVADDSLTIQKVVAITLANEPWVLVEATDESELFGKVRGGGFRLVLLDFNLSESKTGYELASEIKKLSPSTTVLAMLGTFDSVDESGLTQAGVDGKIVKPFDSQKFIQKCRELIDGNEESEILSAAEEESLSFSDDDSVEQESEGEDADEWVMNSPQVDESHDDELSDSADTWDEDTSPGISYEMDSKDSLSSELEGWGVSVPDPIDASSEVQMEVPPVIGGQENDFLWDDSDKEEIENSIEFSTEDSSTADVRSISTASDDEDTVYPENDDLDYPDLTIEEQLEAKKESPVKPTSNLIALDQLSDEDDDNDSLPLRLETKPEEVREDLAREIEDELSPDDFWAVDDESDSSVSIEEHHKSEDDDDRDSFVVGVGDPQAPVEPVKPSSPIDLKVEKSNTQSVSALDEDRIIARIKDSIAPMLEEIVKRYMDEKVEKVAWEIIPDVAENLIKKELKEISQETRNS